HATAAPAINPNGSYHRPGRNSGSGSVVRHGCSGTQARDMDDMSWYGLHCHAAVGEQFRHRAHANMDSKAALEDRLCARRTMDHLSDLCHGHAYCDTLCNVGDGHLPDCSIRSVLEVAQGGTVDHPLDLVATGIRDHSENSGRSYDRARLALRAGAI